MNIFNRTELKITFSLDEQARTREKLAAAGIDYTVKTVNRQSPGPFPSRTNRSYVGSFGQNMEANYEYIFYVARDDYEHALHVIR